MDWGSLLGILIMVPILGKVLGFVDGAFGFGNPETGGAGSGMPSFTLSTDPEVLQEQTNFLEQYNMNQELRNQENAQEAQINAAGTLAVTGAGAALGAGIGAVAGSFGFALGPVGIATAPAGAVVGAAVGGGIAFFAHQVGFI
jgi:hypothetical protein